MARIVGLLVVCILYLLIRAVFYGSGYRNVPMAKTRQRYA